jgi:steroid delta-isomerase-like uncharacterized protein
MSIETTRQTMQRYFSAEDDQLTMLAEDVVFTIMATGEQYHGRDGIAGMLNSLYQVAFNADAVMRGLIFGESSAVWEGDFVGKHVGLFAGIPATNKDVRVPLCVFYELEQDQIKRARVYFEMPVLFQQIGPQVG